MMTEGGRREDLVAVKFRKNLAIFSITYVFRLLCKAALLLFSNKEFFNVSGTSDTVTIDNPHNQKLSEIFNNFFLNVKRS